MEKLTIVKAGDEKDVQTKFGMKKKQGVQFKEYPNVWHDVWASGLKEGQTLEGTRESREYNGKTYWNFTLPKKSASGVDAGKIEELLNGQLTIKLYLRKIMRALKIEDEFTDIEKAREAHNSAQKPVSDGYTSRGANGEAPIKASDVNFDPSNDPDILNGIDF